MNYCVYILRCWDKTLYCGITNCLSKRLAAHNKGTASKYTRSRRPVHLAASTEYRFSKSEALKIELWIKKQPAKDKIWRLQNCVSGSTI